jgi:hypothetical protein
MDVLLWLASEVVFWFLVVVTFGRYERKSHGPRVDWGDAGWKDEAP